MASLHDFSRPRRDIDGLLAHDLRFAGHHWRRLACEEQGPPGDKSGASAIHAQHNGRAERRAQRGRSSAKLEVGGSPRDLSRKTDDYAALEKRDRFTPRTVRHVSPEPPFILAAQGEVDLVSVLRR